MELPVTAGVDGSPESMAAAEWAAETASRRNLPLRLLQVWEWLPSNPHFPLGPEQQRHWAENRLRTTEREIAGSRPGLEVSAEQVPGVPAGLLLRAAAEAELLALGSHGLGTVNGFLYGSVGLQVIARAERPVVLVRAPRVPESESRGVVVLGLDFRLPCDPLIAFAFDEAASRKSALHVVHVWNQHLAYGYAVSPIGPGLVTELQGEQVQALARFLGPWRDAYPGVEVVEHVLHGSVGRDLTEAGAAADLLVVGRRRHGRGVGGHIGHVTHGVLHHAPCPVAVVPHD
ncbi:universal stress protein [Streptomyces meridianus]|uniref:Universal stress protein n=1 Tax=Streptomyces meridianus TaxID=2938945 RepID=A0ABT0X4F5_9ACTN|nr:universal stress protein [Streptomyces meridianus]MCM2577417.1 universal stress protein [Streptomyces meridianus]